MDEPRVGGLAALLVALLAGVLAASSWSPAPDIGTGYEGAHKGQITFTFTTCIVNTTKQLTSIRASGDYDTRDGCFLESDGLHVRWPRWTATNGTFAGSDACGTSVEWTAPRLPQVVLFGLYENDTPTLIGPPDTGTRDDSEQLQDVRPVVVTVE